MKLFGILLFVSVNHISLAQGGWFLDTNPASDISYYTTIYNYTGCSFAELNGDNYVDLIASPKTIFLNNGDGTFSQTGSLPYNIMNGISGNSCADLDNDGDNDIVVSGVPSKVFFNNGNAVFVDSTSQLPNFGLYGSWGAAIGDYNEDKMLDFFFAHGNGYMSPAPPTPCKFFKQGANSFDPVSLPLPPVTDSLNTYTDPFWSDFDLDGDMDLFIATGPVMGIPDYDFCYKNYKTETGLDSLAPLTTELFATQTQDGQCYNFIDYDNDNDLDLCLSNYFSAPTRLYNNSGGIYTIVTTPFSLSTTNIANCWGDYDNDGDLDVIFTNDNQPSRYYRNEAGSGFTYLPVGFTTPTAVNGITNADYDNDGDLDVFTNGIGNNGNTASVGLYINDTVAGNRGFINLKLIGTASNKSAIGAIVRLRATINGNPVWQLREINAQNTFQGQNDLRVHFGLGDAVTVDSISITWPSGAIEQFTDYPVNSFYEITEGAGAVNLSSEELKAPNDAIAVFPNPTTETIQIRISLPAGENAVYTLSDIMGSERIKATVVLPFFTLDLEALPAGVYTLSIHHSGKVLLRRIIKY